MAKLSVIIPVYNGEKYLKESLDSVINQTFKDIEVICIDDKSTDNSLEILKEYAQKDKRIRIFEQEINKGAGPARNLGLDNAKGDYIMFLDPDDWYELTACEDAYNQITKYNNDFTYFNMYLFFENSGVIKVDDERLNLFKDNLDNPHINFRDLDSPFMSYGESWYKIYNRDFLNKNNIRFSCERFGEDNIFYIKSILCAKDVSILNKPLYYYRQRSDSTVSSAANYEDLLAVRKNVYKMVLQDGDAKFINFQIIGTYWSLVDWFRIWTEQDKTIEKDFYIKMREFFIELDKENDLKQIKNHINYKKLRKIIRSDWRAYCVQKFLKNIFSTEKKYFDYKKYKVIKFFGIKISITMEG